MSFALQAVPEYPLQHPQAPELPVHPLSSHCHSLIHPPVAPALLQGLHWAQPALRLRCFCQKGPAARPGRSGCHWGSLHKGKPGMHKMWLMAPSCPTLQHNREAHSGKT